MTSTLPTHRVFLSLGTNLGNKAENLRRAMECIEQRIGRVIATSSVHETAPWGFSSPSSFLNSVVVVDTRLGPRLVLYMTQAIEREMGRSHKTQSSYQDRILDIDLIFYDRLSLQTEELTLPHPQYLERDFVLLPLQELSDFMLS